MISPKPYRAALRPVVISTLAVALVTLGCNGYSPEQHRVEPTVARSTLEQVLKSWQQGETPDSWQSRQPPVVVQDMEWKGGAKLAAFEILGEGEAIDANMHCQVKLKVVHPSGSKGDKTVTYLVGTSPVLTVFRSQGP